MKIPGARTFLAKDGEEWIAFPVKANNIFAGETSRNLDLSIVDRADQYGNDGFVSIDLGKERRLAGEKGPIIGNWKHAGQQQAPAPATRPASPQASTQTAAEWEADDDIPF